MKARLEDFKTGWFGLSLGLKRHELDLLIASFEQLKESGGGHFHAHTKFTKFVSERGIADIEFYLAPDNSEDDLRFDEDD